MYLVLNKKQQQQQQQQKRKIITIDAMIFCMAINTNSIYNVMHMATLRNYIFC